MNKLTAELLQQLKSAAQEEIMCREASDTSDAWQDLASPENILAIIEAFQLLEQDLELGMQLIKRLERQVLGCQARKPALEQQESPTDTYRKIENDGWIEWGGGDKPCSKLVEIEFRSGRKAKANPALVYWGRSRMPLDCDIIAYRVIENDGRQ